MGAIIYNICTVFLVFFNNNKVPHNGDIWIRYG